MDAHRVASAVLTMIVLPMVALAYTACCAHAPPGPPAASAPAVEPGTASGTTAPVRAAGGPRVEPTTAEACHACGGDWAPHGISSQPSCLCPTSDADKRCRDGAECEGQCLADAGEREVTVPGPPARGYFVGRCSRFRTTFGCHRIIAAGALKAGPVALDEPPTELCAD